MSLAAHRRAARQAEQRLELECARWEAHRRALRGALARHSFVWLLGGGFSAGFVAGWLQWRRVLRVGELAVEVAELVLRLPPRRLVSAIRNAARREDDTRT